MGPVSGGTIVLITGVNLPIGHVTCRFGDSLQAPATSDVPSSLICVTPAVSSSGSLQISVSISGATHVSSLLFAFYEDPEPLVIQPSVGPQYGGTLLRVTGRRFSDTGSLFCIFGAASAVRARWVTPFVIDCVTPPWKITGSVSFRISLNGQQYLNVTDAVYTYQQAPVLLSVTPSKSPVVGGSMVNVSGQHFSAMSSTLQLMRCRFGESLVPATRVSSMLLACVAPPNGEGYNTVAVTDNGLDFSDNLVFEYTTTSVIHISPAIGPISGGTYVQLHGSSIPPASNHLSCLFAGSLVVPAVFVTPTQLQCRTPPMSSAFAVSVQITRA
eukprot:5121266-Prymnesium_polylepis.1